ncbi:MAG: RDD family protein [Candidatus Dormibacteraeota bacterium]|nr:RDD family protein [Candidatus Dormibacteraeota bacterium]
MSQLPAPYRAHPLPVAPRFLAAFLDFLILLVPEIIAYVLIAGPTVSRADNYLTQHPKQGVSAALSHTPGYAAANLHFFIVIEAVTALYLIGTYLAFSATVGKLVVGLRITRVDGGPLLVRDVVLRSLPFWVPWLIPGVGLYLNFFQFVGGSILLAFRPDHRGPEDLLGNSIVVWREDQGRSLGDIVAIGPPRQPPATPPDPTPRGGGHLPGWEPAPQPPLVDTPPSEARTDPARAESPEDREERP